MKETRLRNDMSKEDLSQALNGVSIELINKIEKGDFVPTLEYVFDFCEYFNISIDSIIVSRL
jgi:DNA-binding XRE family transcriptional regulator